MCKVWVLAPNENWIVDRFQKEWFEDNQDISTLNIDEATIIWALADWCFDRIPYHILRKQQLGLVKIVTTVHHITPEKFGKKEKQNFINRDAYTDMYHVYNNRTLLLLSKLTSKPIKLIKYWANDKIFYKTSTMKDLRKKYNLSINKFIVGSFQRDTEGAGISVGIYLPKLEKGPDLFVKAIQSLKETHGNNIHVLLAGWRRQYIIQELKNLNIDYSYFELPEQTMINELYQVLDLYLVTARHEGGPQSLIECGLCGVPVISTPVGIAEQVLPKSAIMLNNEVSTAAPTIPNVESMTLKYGYECYRKLFLSL